MQFETLKKRNKKIVIVIFILIITSIVTSRSLAKYKVAESINIAKGTINYSLSDLSIMGIYLESESGYTQTDTIPTSGYILNSGESHCELNGTDINASIIYDNSIQSLSISPIATTGTKCYLYFDVKPPENAQEIIASSTIIDRTSFSSILTDKTAKTLYTTKDDDGTSYYYAGAPTDNWVKFAGLYWRIIRINGDGTIRLIYSGTSASTTGEDTQYTTSAFNSTYSDNMYVGLKYTSGNVHGTGTKSAILGQLETFYTSKLASYANYLDINAGFCNDRTPYTNSSGSTSGGGTGTTKTYYAGYIRLYINREPSLKCADSSDLFTKSGATKGNKALTYPVGLITADEVVYAGGVSGITNESYYLYTGQYYWTMTPFWCFDSNAHVFSMYSTGSLNYNSVTIIRGVRPVINLKADTQFKAGSLGTIDSPYEVV